MSKRRREEEMVQKVIDLETGEDITARYISRRLGELEELADELILKAVEELALDPAGRDEIYERYDSEMHERIGTGSIGPATAAAAPLMNEKKRELARRLGVSE
ncbi:hypothetical protein H8D76_02015, partial [Candidatus Bathyarchaeota archaeon]|nr:hypothetical protein [Candidatus Bathyarchaeota archaeon]